MNTQTKYSNCTLATLAAAREAGYSHDAAQMTGWLTQQVESVTQGVFTLTADVIVSVTYESAQRPIQFVFGLGDTFQTVVEVFRHEIEHRQWLAPDADESLLFSGTVNNI